jgi:hypothetical protein
LPKVRHGCARWAELAEKHARLLPTCLATERPFEWGTGGVRLAVRGELVDAPVPSRSDENRRGSERPCATTGEMPSMLVVAFLPEDTFCGVGEGNAHGHRARPRSSGLRAARPHQHRSQVEQYSGSRSDDPHACAWAFSPKGVPAAPPVGDASSAGPRTSNVTCSA